MERSAPRAKREGNQCERERSAEQKSRADCTQRATIATDTAQVKLETQDHDDYEDDEDHEKLYPSGPSRVTYHGLAHGRSERAPP